MKKQKKAKCAIKGCNREIKVIKHGLCNTHSVRYYRTGKVGDKPIQKRRVVKKFEF